MRKFFIFLLLVYPLILKTQNPTRDCYSEHIYKKYVTEFPQVKQQLEELERLVTSTRLHTRGADVTIPVVVHVVYNNDTENISDEQVYSQIDVLNRDFNKENSEVANTPNIFANVVADCGIRFQLATRDPQGLATTGIVRHKSSNSVWGVNDDIKLPSKSGFSPWSPSKYLNIYVCDMGTKAIGFSSFPGMPEEVDGIVIDYKAFGTTGTAKEPFNLGRTCVHEIGHWLGLFHIWGDTDCGNDYVEDTPTHKTQNKGCPAFPQYSSCNGVQSVDMTMNFMDYVNDACMYMFTKGQSARMMAIIEKKRSGLMSSDALLAAPNRQCTIQNIQAKKIDTETAQLTWNNLAGVAAYNLEYRAIYESEWQKTSTHTPYITLNELQAGTTYEVKIKSDCNNMPYSQIFTFTTQKVAYRVSAEKGGITVFPNPATTTVTVAIEPNDDYDFIVTVSNIQGQIQFEKRYSKDTPSVQLDFSELPQGVYWIMVLKNGKRVVNKVMKVRE